MMRARAGICAAAFVAAVVLAGCGGAASHLTPASSPAPAKTQAITFTVQLPSHTPSSRGTRYVSPSTQVIKAAVTPAGGGTTTTAQNACANAQCTVTIAAPIGTDTFTIELYDGQNKLLSSGTTAQTIVEGQTNTVTVVFGGVIASVSVQPSTIAFVRGVPSSTSVAVNALDADGNVIVAPPANYSSSIAVSINDTTGSVTLSAPTVTQPGTVLTLTYNGSAAVPATLTITASAAGAVSGTASVTFNSTAYLYENHAQLVRYTVGAGAIGSPLPLGGCAQFAAPRMVAVSPVDGLVYADIYDCSTESGATRARGSGAAGAGFTLAGGMGPAAVDGAARLYVATQISGMNVFATPLSGVAQPIRRVATFLNDVALDSTGALYGVTISGSASKINVYAPNANGIAAPIRMLQPPGGGSFYALAVDRSNNLYASGTLNGSPAVFVYAPGAAGAATPSRTITGPATQLTAPATIAADASGYAYVGTPNAILVFAPAANGNAAPTATQATSFEAVPGRLAVDDVGAAAPAPPSGNPAPAAHTAAAATIANVNVSAMTAGPDTALWLSESHGHVYRVGATNDPGGTGNLMTFTVPGDPTDITTGGDGALWVAEDAANAILRLTTVGAFTQYPLPSSSQGVRTIGLGGDGNVWFFTYNGSRGAGRITPAGVITEFALPPNEMPGLNLIAAPDGNTYSVLINPDQTGVLTRIAPNGTMTAIASLPYFGTVCIGGDGNFWVEMLGSGQFGGRRNQVARIPFAGGSPAIFPIFQPDSASYVRGIATGPFGDIYVGQYGIEAVNTSGVQQFDVLPTVFGNAPSHPSVVRGPDGEVWYFETGVSPLGTTVSVLTP